MHAHEKQLHCTRACSEVVLFNMCKMPMVEALVVCALNSAIPDAHFRASCRVLAAAVSARSQATPVLTCTYSWAYSVGSNAAGMWSPSDVCPKPRVLEPSFCQHFEHPLMLSVTLRLRVFKSEGIDAEAAMFGISLPVPRQPQPGCREDSMLHGLTRDSS